METSEALCQIILVTFMLAGIASIFSGIMFLIANISSSVTSWTKAVDTNTLSFYIFVKRLFGDIILTMFLDTGNCESRQSVLL